MLAINLLLASSLFLGPLYVWHPMWMSKVKGDSKERDSMALGLEQRFQFWWNRKSKHHTYELPSTP